MMTMTSIAVPDKILIVDDEPFIGLHLKAVLEREGYSAESFPSGAACLEWIERNGPPDLVILDINLGENGLSSEETVARMREFADVPVIAHSAYTDRETLEVTKAFSRYGHIQKVPGNSEVVLSTVELALKLHRTEQELSRQKRKYRELSHYLQDVQDELKAFLSKEIHDDIGQLLTALKINLDLHISKHRCPEGRDLVETVRDIADQAIEKSRRLIETLRPADSGSNDLEELLAHHCREFSRNFRVEVRFSPSGRKVCVKKQTRLPILRIVQEALTNGVRHGGAGKLEVMIHEPSAAGFVIEIVDDGCGIDPAADAVREHYGILNMVERAERLGGSIGISSVPGEGARIELRLPGSVFA